MSPDNELFVVYFRNFFPQEWIDDLATDVWDEEFRKIAHWQNNSRGHYLSVDLGVRQRRGGDYSFHFSSASKSPTGKKFVAKHDRVWQAVRCAMDVVDSAFVDLAAKSVHKSIFADVFSYGVANLTSTHLNHRDHKDFKWAGMFPFGTFTGGHLLLKSLGVKLLFQPTDFVVFHSYKLPHQITKVDGERGSMVLTSHYTVVTGHPRNKKK